MDSHYILFFIFAVVTYFIVTDESVAAAFYYALKLTGISISKNIWWIKNNPKNPIVKYLIWRRSIKMAEEIRRQIGDQKH